MKPAIYFIISIMLVLNLACSSEAVVDNTDYAPPTINYQPRLIYPIVAQENNWQGHSVILVKIAKDGSVLGTSISTSTGYEVLDRAAEDFCKEIIFNPAMNKDKPLISQLKLGIDFKLNNDNYNPESYVNRVRDLYKQIQNGEAINKSHTEAEILQEHREFVAHSIDALQFNNYISMVIQPQIVSDWQNVWNTWPLSFLVFHDFIDRYKDYEDNDKVKMLLYSTLKEDVNYIRRSPGNVDEKEAMIGKIITFMKKEYPDINIDSINFDIVTQEKPII